MVSEPRFDHITNELRQNGAGRNSDQPPTIHTWLERFGKQKPRSFSSSTIPVDAENWIAHIEKLFEVLGCANEFKARLASYKFEGDALSWWKAFKQAKGGEAYVETLSWKDFREIFFLQYFPMSEQQKYEKEYHTIRQREDELTGEFMKRFLRLAGFIGKKEAQEANDERNIELLRERGSSNNKRNRDGDRIQPAARNNNQTGYDQRRSDGRGYDRQNNNQRDFGQRGNDGRSYDRQGGRACYRITGACFSYGLTGHMAMDCPKNDRSCSKGNGNDKQLTAKGKVFSLTRDQVANSSDIVSGTLLMNDRVVFVLFDTGATHSVISITLTKYNMHDFDIIMGIDWLTKHHATIVCHTKSVIFGDLDKPEFVYQESQLGLLASIIDTSSDGPSIETHLVVRDFSDVFPKELPGIPPEREVEFGIELVSGTQPISKALYRMAPIELKELKEQLQELLDLGFICPLMVVADALSRKSGMLANLQIEPEIIRDLEHMDIDDPTFREAVLSEAYSSPFSIHPGSTKILADIFQQEIVRLHGTPASIVFDRDPRFTSRFWKGLQNSWGTRLKFSMTFHPKADRQTERTIQALEDMLRAPICWNEVGERVIEGLKLVKVTNEKVTVAKEKIKEARGVRRFRIKRNLSPPFIGPFKILDRVGEVSYHLALPS
nr:hypothetical protein [Tanacetum cinerariifolium]